jgi:3-hydroxymyristoyl/3-hydroxydecanoyl-(acyl carrier protein) dehydratase
LPKDRLGLLDTAAVSDDWAIGRRKVDPREWFFDAHFYQDPVCPGSLGLESFVTLVKLLARRRFGSGRFESLALGVPHTWLYRGQYTPVNKQVELSSLVTSVDEKERLLKAEGLLSVDGLTIYQMKDFAVRVKG